MSFNNCVYANFNFEFNKVIKRVNEKRYSDLIFICIGTNKIVGDSFGPIIGEILKRNVKDRRIKVIGNLTNNINAKNIKNIKFNCVNPYVISIDSALSDTIEPGNVFIIKKGLVPGSALNKKATAIGNIAIKGIVAKDEKSLIKNYFNLKNADYKLILKFSKNISKIILQSIKFLNL